MLSVYSERSWSVEDGRARIGWDSAILEVHAKRVVAIETGAPVVASAFTRM
jgi:hypothetical protein